MITRKHAIMVAAIGLAGLTISGAAFASHGRVGLWSVTITMGGTAPAMPDLSKLPPEVAARMRAMGMSTNGNSITTQHCMTAQEVATDTPHIDSNNSDDCTVSNVMHQGNAMSADMSCRGNFKGSGHMQFTYDSDSHYAGQLTMTGTVNGQPISREQKFDGHWLSADCKGITR
ncbi:MAG TPA: DUF3617 domain-containing protein [Rhizomicrobium sp.]|nr:DUF3617 domain-containing protein [Rhizomicrobium sp.]